MRRLLTAIAERAARSRPRDGEPQANHAQRAEPRRDSSPAPLAPPPRAWNLWELDRLAREHGGPGAARAQERAYVLVFLREFANAAGELPPDFDPLVRESFGELLAAR